MKGGHERPALLATRTGSGPKLQTGHHRAACGCPLRSALWRTDCPPPSKLRFQGRCYQSIRASRWDFLRQLPFHLLQQQGLQFCKSGVSASLSGQRTNSFTQPEDVGCRRQSFDQEAGPFARLRLLHSPFCHACETDASEKNFFWEYLICMRKFSVLRWSKNCDKTLAF